MAMLSKLTKKIALSDTSKNAIFFNAFTGVGMLSRPVFIKQVNASAEMIQAEEPIKFIGIILKTMASCARHTSHETASFHPRTSRMEPNSENDADKFLRRNGTIRINTYDHMLYKNRSRHHPFTP